MALPWSARRWVVILTLVLLAPALVIVFYFVGPGSGNPSSGAPRLFTGSPTPPATASPSVAPIPAKTLRATLSPVESAQPKPPSQATGVFRTARGDNRIIGTAGSVRRFCIQVEDGTGVNPEGFGAAVIAVLSDERGWIASNKAMFQWMPDCSNVKFTIRLAVPKTVDRLCAPVASPEGYYSCWSGAHVMLNLDRWKYAVPHYNGDLATYRQYLINHEVGHSLGHQHVTCSGNGNVAAVMVPQTRSLYGCVANGRPYDADGNLIK